MMQHFEFEPENSSALGSGFRCGFLGLLNLEIIEERLDREFNLGLITTAPSVIYKVYTNDGEMIELYNPSDLPEPAKIKYMKEPYVEYNIMVPRRLCWECNGIMPIKKRHIHRYVIFR